MKLVKAALGVLLTLAVVAGCFLLPERVLEWTAVQGIVGTGTVRTAFGASAQSQEAEATATAAVTADTGSATEASEALEITAEAVVEYEVTAEDRASVVEILYQLHNSPVLYTAEATEEAQDEALIQAEEALLLLGTALDCSLETFYSGGVMLEPNCMILDMGGQQREIWDIVLSDGQGQEIWMYLDGQSGCILMLHIQGDLAQAGVPLEPELLLEAFCTVCLGVEDYAFYEVAQPSGDGHVYSLTVYDGGLEAPLSMTFSGEVVSIG